MVEEASFRSPRASTQSDSATGASCQPLWACSPTFLGLCWTKITGLY